MRPLSSLRLGLARRKVRRRFRHELALLSGGPAVASSGPSVLFFTVERAASRFVARVMTTLALDVGLTPIDLDSYFYEIGSIRTWVEGGRDRGASLYRENGYLFGPFRTSSPNLLALDWPSLLVLRDPRDVLVSLYFNYAFESRRPLLADDELAEQIEGEMASYRRGHVDDFVLDMARPTSHVRRTFEDYQRRLVGRPTTLVLTYEGMLSDFRSWLDRILTHFDWSPKDRTIVSILRSADFTASSGPKAGRRQVEPGEYRRRLRPETVVALNAELEGLLVELGYEV